MTNDEVGAHLAMRTKVGEWLAACGVKPKLT